MAQTRTQIRKRVLLHMDALQPSGAASQRWNTTPGTGEVDQRIGIVFSREWRRILNAQPYYRWSAISATTDASGRIAISDLTTGTDDDVNRFYRVLGLSVDNLMYTEAEFIEMPLASANNTAYNSWYRVGDYIQIIPVVANNPVTVWVNHLPCRYDNLQTDSSLVVFPEDYEDVLCLEAAAMLLSKGGAETGAGAELAAWAEQLRQDMLQDIARFSIKPLRFKAEDTSSDWAG